MRAHWRSRPAHEDPLIVATVRRGGELLGPAIRWIGRVVYVVGDVAGQAVLVEAWLAAEHLTPAGG